jgi:DNA-binding HxlR family transcriptional regulator
MKRASFRKMECPIARALDEIGEGWTLLVLRDALLGARQFAEFEARLGIPSSTLARRLAELVDKGLLAQELYEASPPRHAYVPTEKGRELFAVVLALAAWGNRWVFGEGAEAIVPVDASTGARVDPVVVDRLTGSVLGPGGVRLAPGPQASEKLRRALEAAPRVLGEAAPARGGRRRRR